MKLGVLCRISKEKNAREIDVQLRSEDTEIKSDEAELMDVYKRDIRLTGR